MGRRASLEKKEQMANFTFQLTLRQKELFQKKADKAEMSMVGLLRTWIKEK